MSKPSEVKLHPLEIILALLVCFVLGREFPSDSSIKVCYLKTKIKCLSIIDPSEAIEGYKEFNMTPRMILDHITYKCLESRFSK